ncbi:hypothetical protein LVJ94_19925 [Pendulispora rubella]|uniref:BNR repeat domain protein n=1 Tax=Pendulispora rubella TaxID=2741070 RepID=A0ABZ2LEX6_9BACT
MKRARGLLAVAALLAPVATACNWLLGFEDDYRVLGDGEGNGGGCTEGSCGRIRHVSAGGSFACVLLEDGTVTCWGGNEVGQLGVPPAGDAGGCPTGRPCRWQPRMIPMGGVKFTAIATGYDFACGLAEARDGGGTPIYCWGSNQFAQLGHAKGELGDRTCKDIDGDPVTCNWTPQEVLGARGEYAALAAGWESACAALKSDGTTFCWGSNGKSVRGTSATDAGVAPNRVNAPKDPPYSGYAGLAMSLGNARACGRVMGGSLTHCWGDNRCLEQRGSLGDDTDGDHSATPITVRKVETKEVLAGVVETITLDGASCASANDGVWCWGSNFYGGLGEDALSDRVFAGRVPDIPPVDRLSGAYHHACAIKDGAVTCWGLNGAGQLGRGTVDDDDACLSRDKRKCGKTAAAIPNFEAVDISSGADFNVALRADGTVWAWGSNQSGKCGQPHDSDAGVAVCGGGEPCFPTPRRIAGVGPLE